MSNITLSEYQIRKKSDFSKKIIIFMIIILSSLLNLILYRVNICYIEIPLSFNTIFTVTIAIIYGPLAGSLTGLFTGLFLDVFSTFSGLYWSFTLCGMIAGFICGLLSKKNHFQTFFHLTLIIFFLGVINSILGSTLSILFLEDFPDKRIEMLFTTYYGFGFSIFYANFWARIPFYIIDMMVSVYIAFFFKKYIFNRVEKTNVL